MNKIQKIFIIFILFFSGITFLYANNFSDVKNRVDNMRASTIDAWIFWEIITKFFWINWFLNFDFLWNFSSNYLLQFDWTKIINSIIYSDWNNVWIWTNSPTEKLEISWNTKLNWDLKWLKKVSFDSWENFRIDTNSSWLLFDWWDWNRDFLVYDERVYLWDLVVWYNDTANITTYDTDEDLVINPNWNWKVVINWDLESSWPIIANQFLYASDKRLKKDVSNLNNSLDKINKLQWVKFIWKDSGKKDIWLIAQEVEKVYPELVETRKIDWMKTIKYWNLISPLIESVKELTNKVKKLELENIELNKKIKNLELK